MKKAASEPIVFAFDTSSPTLAAAIRVRGKTRAVWKKCPARHSSALFCAAGALFKSARVRWADVGLFAVGLGPGSFTGLRVGVTAAKGLAFALQKKLVGLSTQLVIAAHFPSADKPVCVVQDARREKVFMGVFWKKKVIAPPRLLALQEFLQNLDKGLYYAGDGVELHGKDISRIAGKQALLGGPKDWRPDPRRMIELALERHAARDWDDPMTLAPEYLYSDTCNVTAPRQFEESSHGRR